MIKFTKVLVIFLLAVIAFGAKAQSTQGTAITSSPYSRYGLGDINPMLLPQNVAMGGIATAINKISGYNSINPLNPASYGAINFTTIDAGLSATVYGFSQTNPAGNGTLSANSSNFKLSHVAFAFPVTKHSAFSFGLLPYSSLGYNYRASFTRNGMSGTLGSVDTTITNIYSGNGSLSKTYLGYGIGLGKHLLIGANVSFIFGNLTQYTSTELPTNVLAGGFDTRDEKSNSVHGFDYDFGAQYSIDLSETKHIVLGYSASTASNLNTSISHVVSNYTYDSEGNENIATDSLENQSGNKSNIHLPQINHFGISYQYDTHFLIGADYTIGKWSALTINGVNQGLQDSKTFNIGGQFTPDLNALHSFWLRTDYRLGFIYDQTNLNLYNTNINRYAVTFGLGIPLAPNNTSFYKINFAVEAGKRGTLSNGLVKENYINLHLGFTLNDRWFQRFKFE